MSRCRSLEFAATSQVLLVRHATTMIDVDVSRAWLPFELEAIARAEMTKLAGVSLPVARAEDHADRPESIPRVPRGDPESTP